jgi:hypothetical protein
MPWVKISSDCHKDMKQYVVDVDELSLGELVEAAFEYCMENLEDFEKFLDLDTAGQEEETEKEGE